MLYTQQEMMNGCEKLPWQKRAFQSDVAQRGSCGNTGAEWGLCFNEQFSSLFVNWGTKDYVNVGLLPREEKIKRPDHVLLSFLQ